MNIQERESRSLFHTYKRIPLEIERGEGVYLMTKDGTRYLDMFGGLAVNALGYSHPAVVAAINDQASKYIHLSNYFLQEPQIALAEAIVQYSGYSKVFFANSGTEAVEGAMKLVRKWGSTHGKTDILSFSRAFHGRTYGPLSMMDNQKYKQGFGPFLPGCTCIEYNNPDQLRQAVSSSTTAVILEYIQGEGGIRPVTNEFIVELASLKKQYGFLVIADEIQSGFGRTGKMFAFQHFQLQPDIVVVAKPIGGGLPLGAILGNDVVADILTPGAHGTTFGGNPVACAAGVATVREIAEKGLVKNAEVLGEIFKAGLLQLKEALPTLIREVRGIGLMLGMELSIEGDPLVTAMREKHILINCTDQTVLRFLPPLILQETHIQQTLAALHEVFLQQKNHNTSEKA